MNLPLLRMNNVRLVNVRLNDLPPAAIGAGARLSCFNNSHVYKFPGIPLGMPGKTAFERFRPYKRGFIQPILLDQRHLLHLREDLAVRIFHARRGNAIEVHSRRECVRVESQLLLAFGQVLVVQQCRYFLA